MESKVKQKKIITLENMFIDNKDVTLIEMGIKEIIEYFLDSSFDENIFHELILSW